MTTKKWLALHVAAWTVGAALGVSLVRCAHADEAADPAAPDIGQLYAEVAATDPRVTVLGAYEHPVEGSPFASGWLPTRQGCVLLVDGDNLDTFLKTFSPGVPAAVRERTAIAHEFAHCLQRAGMPDVPTPRTTHQAELFSDLYALAWTAKYHPEDEEQAYSFLWNLRHEIQDTDKLHPRASELRKFDKVVDTPQAAAYRALIAHN